MKKLFFAMAIFMASANAMAASKTVLKCAVGVIGTEGARVNVIQNDKGEIRANLIFGTTVSGTMYRLTQTPEGFSGVIRGKSKFTIKLVVSDEIASNKYISGTRAQVIAVFPDLREESGVGQISTDLKDEFICGKQIADFGS